MAQLGFFDADKRLEALSAKAVNAPIQAGKSDGAQWSLNTILSLHEHYPPNWATSEALRALLCWGPGGIPCPSLKKRPPL
jgi:hypothetical protein